MELAGCQEDLFECPIVPQILHGTRIFHDLLVRQGLPRLLCLAGCDPHTPCQVPGRQTGSLDAAALGGSGFRGGSGLRG
jgi:hypothetical protein